VDAITFSTGTGGTLAGRHGYNVEGSWKWHFFTFIVKVQLYAGLYQGAYISALAYIYIVVSPESQNMDAYVVNHSLLFVCK
jgi:hypothetical protein